jgi:ribonuclease P protein component
VRNTLPKSEILRGRNFFADIVQQGRRFDCRSFICYVDRQSPTDISGKKEAHAPHVRVGFAVSKKALRRAVERNRVKRIFREVYRIHKTELFEASKRKGYRLSILFVFKGTSASLKTASLFHDVESQWLVLIPQIISSL